MQSLPVTHETHSKRTHATRYPVINAGMKKLFLAFVISTILVLYYTDTASPFLLSMFTPVENHSTGYSLESLAPREAYVTFLSSRTTDPYFESVRLMLFSLRYDPSTLDPFHRDFVVIVPPGIPERYVTHLTGEGAIVSKKPMINSLPTPENGWKSEWQEVYTKLWLFNLTQYDRVVYYDADHLILKPVHDIWNVEGSHPPSGLASLGSGDGGNLKGSNYFLAGFFLACPSETLMKDLLQVKDFDPVYPEQNLMNKYFDKNGSHPWVELDEIHERISPQDQHVDKGYHTVHEKLWKMGPEGFKKLYWEKKGRMDMFYELRNSTAV